jgi:peptidylprolyl isomerase
VPPDKGYGAQGREPIKPNETLVFVIDAVQVTPPA